MIKKRLLAVFMAVTLMATGIGPAVHMDNTIAVAEAAKKKAKTPSVKKIRKAVVKVYGDEYAPDILLTAEEINERYGIIPAWYTDIIAEIPMISANNDTLIIAKAKNKKTRNKIKKCLTKYKEDQLNLTMQYPAAIYKLQGSTIFVKDNYVFLVMLGFIDNSIEQTGTDEQIVEAYKAETQKGVDAIKALFKK